ncbi:MAG: hypothetical protein M1838_004830 [Thelocarpon superellum]|nr:MAG: hypothetical protein M1838_004830 [Thelocarpon superellum]
MAKDVQTEQNEYEAQRAANIAQNKLLLQKLQLESAGLGIAPAKAKSKPAATASQRRARVPVKKEAAELAPRRTSSRLAGLQADSEVAKRKAEDEYVAIQQAAKAKRQRVGGDLNLSDIVVAGKTWDKSENFLVDAYSTPRYARTFTEADIKTTGDKELKALRERMSGLKLYEGFTPNQIKITPERVVGGPHFFRVVPHLTEFQYALAFHPNPDKPLVFAGDKMGNVGIFDGSQTGNTVKEEQGDNDDDDDETEEAVPDITTLHLHTRTISSFLFPPADSSTLLTASYDSSIRSLDLRGSKATEVYAPADADEDEPISAIDVAASAPQTLYFSTLNGTFGRHDMRAPASNAGGTWRVPLSEKKIGGFSLHPLHAHQMATASLDRKLKLWDLRKMSGVGKEPAFLGEHESRLSVSHANWNSVGQIATSSYDDTIKIHDFAGCADWKAGHPLTEDVMKPKTIIRHNNQTGRWVTILRAQWQLHPPDGIQKLCIGNMNRYVDVYTAKGEQLAQLGGDDITAVPAVAQFHPSVDWIAGATASGKLCLWM